MLSRLKLAGRLIFPIDGVALLFSPKTRSSSFRCVYRMKGKPNLLRGEVRVDTSRKPVGQIRGRKQSNATFRVNEERWRQIFGNSIIGITLLDSDFRFVDASPTFQKMVGYTSEELRRFTPLDISVEDEREINRALFLELQQGRRQNYQIVKRLTRKDGGVIWVRIYTFAVHATGLTPDMYFGLVIDITESKNAEQALLVAQSELTRMSQLTTMGAMAASIAHEINQPLAAIITEGHAGMRWLSRATPDLKEAAASLRRIIDNADRATTIINGIRAMFKTDSGEKTDLEINELVLEVIWFADGELQRGGIVVQTDLAENLAPVRADRVQLQQVMLNLISNAVEAMRFVSNRSRLLTIKSELHAPDGVLITFKDTGTGIAAQDLDRIFAPFVTTKSNGMGMGLAICRSIVEAHRGRIWVTSGEPYGSEFHTFLPGADPP
jgi:PAS domain S-box-containing protein